MIMMTMATMMKMIIMFIIITTDITINTKILLGNNRYNILRGFIFWLKGWIITCIAEVYFNLLETTLVVLDPYQTMYML